jgi:hypothetical protein
VADFVVSVRGVGRISAAAYGVADAEHLVEKEIARAWPAARVEVLEVGRGSVGRIVEEFTVAYRVSGDIRVSAESTNQARRAAFRRARELLADSRYARTEWERGDVLTPPATGTGP